MTRRSVLNFASKLKAQPTVQNYQYRSESTQKAIDKSNQFYRENIEKREQLLEQQIAYRDREVQRPPVQQPLNIISLRNGTEWYFDSNKKRFINTKTQEELTVEQRHTYNTMIFLQSNSYASDNDVPFGFSISFSPSSMEADAVTSLTAVPTLFDANDEPFTTFTFRWSYTGQVDI